ncbi:MAG: amino acid ABC transporter permease [Candidatus Thermoplasmatota archaeon]|nr:amino acid ABC transporter permease [Candidatus Thermoplasmatota archaeon]
MILLGINSIINNIPFLLEGLGVTIALTVVSVTLATVFGILLAMGRCYTRQPLPFLIYIYEKVFRGLPLLIIFFLVYFGLSQQGIHIKAFYAAVTGLVLHSTAYQIQIFRSAILAIPEGQQTAAMSLGMSKPKTIFYIILPQVLRLSIPGWSNEFTILLKDTSIAFSIGVVELMARGDAINSMNPSGILHVLLFIALLYFILVFSINKGLNYLEKRYRLSGYEVTAVQ